MSGFDAAAPWPGSMPGFLMTREEYDRQPDRARFHCRYFRTWDEKEAADYAAAMERILNGRAHLVQRKDLETPEGLRIWLEWAVEYKVPAGTDWEDGA